MSTQVPEHLRNLSQLLGESVASSRPLGGGSLSEIWEVTLSGGGSAVVKTGPAPRVEAEMLNAIALSGAPAPRVLAVDDSMLVIEVLRATGMTETAWTSLARALARLHSCHGERYGWRDDYRFGEVKIVNTPTDGWPGFWGQHRLVEPSVSLPRELSRRIASLASDLPNRLPRLPAPSLLHGDLWGGNVLAADGRVTGLVDPACYYGHSEVDVAMLCLFDSPPESFFSVCSSLDAGFQERRPIYQLWPAIVHARLFGSGYYGLIERLLRSCGH